jgi:hypothetical protein
MLFISGLTSIVYYIHTNVQQWLRYDVIIILRYVKNDSERTEKWLMLTE